MLRFAAVGFLVALLAAPIAGEAARAPARFAVTLEGSIVDRVTYERTVTTDDCTIRRAGFGGHELAIRSLRPTTIVVTGRASRIAYRPPQVATLGVAPTRLAGSFTDLRRCRFLPPERRTESCAPASGSVRLMGAAFRGGRNAIAFRRLGPSPGDVTACGLDQAIVAGWLHLVPGRIDQAALMNGRSLRIVARALGTRESTVAGDPTGKIIQRTTVRWTLTFRRRN